jgi:hypothetical protein
MPNRKILKEGQGKRDLIENTSSKYWDWLL